MNKHYCDFCGNPTEQAKESVDCSARHMVNYGSINWLDFKNKADGIPFMAICIECVPIWNRLAPLLIQAIKDEASKRDHGV